MFAVAVDALFNEVNRFIVFVLINRINCELKRVKMRNRKSFAEIFAVKVKIF